METSAPQNEAFGGLCAHRQGRHRQKLLHCIKEKATGMEIRKIKLKPRSDGYDVTLRLSIPYGIEVAASTHALQHYIIDQIKQLTGIQIHQLALRIDTVHAKQ
mgnify:CR=1 FL=1